MASLDSSISREQLRRTLKVISGGKEIYPSKFEGSALNDDPFLRSHYLEKGYQHSASEKIRPVNAGTRQISLWERDDFNDAG